MVPILTTGAHNQHHCFTHKFSCAFYEFEGAVERAVMALYPVYKLHVVGPLRCDAPLSVRLKLDVTRYDT
jgi:hypothetical protein